MSFRTERAGILLDISLLFLPFLCSFSVLLIVPSIGFDLVRYAGAFFMLLVVPSYWLSTVLLKDFRLTSIQLVVLGYVPAVSLLLFLYWIGLLIALPKLPLMLTIVSISGLLVSWYQSRYTHVVRNEAPIPRVDLVVVSTFYLIATMIFFVLFTSTTVVPTDQYLGIYYQDSLWTVSNTWAIIREGVPVQNSRFEGLAFGYHMAQNLYQAMMHEFTGIDPFHLHFHIDPFYTWFFIVSVAFWGGKILAGCSVRRTILWVFVILFSAPAISWVKNGYLGHLYYNPLSTFFGFSAFLLFVLLMYRYSKEKSTPVVYVLLVLALVFSTKASFLFVIPLCLLGFLVLQTILGRSLGRTEVWIAFGTIVVVGLLRFSIYSATGEGSLALSLPAEGSGRVRSVLARLMANPSDLITNLFGIGYRVLRNLASVGLTLYGLTFLLVYFASRRFRSSISKEKQFAFFIIIFIAVSAVLPALVNFPGGQIYFIWYAIILTTCPFAFILDYLFSVPWKRWYRLTAVSVSLLSVALFLSFFLAAFGSPWRQVALGHREPWDARATISQAEWDAMIWLRQNAGRDAVVVSDRRGFDHETSGAFVGRFYGYSATSGLQFYNEGDAFGDISDATEKQERWDIVNALLSAETVVESESLWGRVDADYVVQSLRFNKEIGAGFEEHFSPIYSNEHVVIHAEASGR